MPGNDQAVSSAAIKIYGTITFTIASQWGAKREHHADAILNNIRYNCSDDQWLLCDTYIVNFDALKSGYIYIYIYVINAFIVVWMVMQINAKLVLCSVHWHIYYANDYKQCLFSRVYLSGYPCPCMVMHMREHMFRYIYVRFCASHVLRNMLCLQGISYKPSFTHYGGC